MSKDQIYRTLVSRQPLSGEPDHRHGLDVPEVSLDSLDILDVGNTIQISGGLWSGNGKFYLIPLPDSDVSGDVEILRLTVEEFERFLNQTDVLDVRGPGKAILRKSQRQIDQHIAWKVFERDGYRCRYCGLKAPLSVDHVILYEDGGASVEANLVSSCRKDNKTRGSMDYQSWLASDYYCRISANLTAGEKARNHELIARLPELRAIKAKPRSR